MGVLTTSEPDGTQLQIATSNAGPLTFEVQPAAAPPVGPVLRKVASGTTNVPGFGSTSVGPFIINPDEAATVFVYGPTDAFNPSSWGVPPQGEFCWQFHSVGGDAFSLGFQNAGGADALARWVVIAAQL